MVLTLLGISVPAFVDKCANNIRKFFRLETLAKKRWNLCRYSIPGMLATEEWPAVHSAPSLQGADQSEPLSEVLLAARTNVSAGCFRAENPITRLPRSKVVRSTSLRVSILLLGSRVMDGFCRKAARCTDTGQRDELARNLPHWLAEGVLVGICLDIQEYSLTTAQDRVSKFPQPQQERSPIAIGTLATRSASPESP